MKVFEDMKKHIESSVEACNANLYGCEMLPGNKSNTLRIFIDNDSAVTDKLCHEVGQHLMTASAVDFPAILNYTLEISSPGLDRKLFSVQHCVDSIGKKVKFKTKNPIEGQKNFRGEIVNVVDNILQVNVDNKMFNLNWENIDKIRIIFEMGHQS